jgi:hypothetical protein
MLWIAKTMLKCLKKKCSAIKQTQRIQITTKRIWTITQIHQKRCWSCSKCGFWFSNIIKRGRKKTEETTKEWSKLVLK